MAYGHHCRRLRLTFKTPLVASVSFPNPTAIHSSFPCVRVLAIAYLLCLLAVCMYCAQASKKKMAMMEFLANFIGRACAGLTLVGWWENTRAVILVLESILIIGS